MAAPQGVYFSGLGILGNGAGAIHGAYWNTGTFPQSQPLTHSYSYWQSLAPDDFYLYGGAGGGGQGSAGAISQDDPADALLALIAAEQLTPRATIGRIHEQNTVEFREAPIESSSFHELGLAVIEEWNLSTAIPHHSSSPSPFDSALADPFWEYPEALPRT